MMKIRPLGYSVLAVIALLTLGYTSLIRPSLLVLPEKSEVESAKAELFDDDQLLLFEVDPGNTSRLLDELQPAKRDWAPADWISLGRIALKCKGGKIVVINLYKTGQPEGAFSIHIDGDHSSSLVSNYFRGGNNDRIEAIIKEAYQASKHHK